MQASSLCCTAHSRSVGRSHCRTDPPGVRRGASRISPGETAYARAGHAGDESQHQRSRPRTGWLFLKHGRKGSSVPRLPYENSVPDETDRPPARPRCTFTDGLRIQAAAVSADDLDGRMAPQPPGCTLHTPVVQNVDDRASLEINHDSAVSRRSPPAPGIDTNHPNLGGVVSNRGIPLQLPQDGVAEPLHEALARTAARVLWPSRSTISTNLVVRRA
jgi:hypothetical protein